MDIVIGLDGFHTGLLDVCPNIRSLWEKGTSGVSESVIPTVTGSAWATIHTSVPPGDHGIASFLGEGEHIYDGRDIEQLTFYEILEEKGKDILLQNLPYTYPPKIDGDLVTSWLTKSSEVEDFVYPTSLLEKYESLDGYDFAIEMESTSEYHLEKMRSRFPFFSEVLDKREHDLVFFYIHATDAVQHQRMEGTKEEGEIPHRVMKEADNFVGEVAENLREGDSLILMSDHGFKMKEGAFVLNDWLLEKGYLKTESGGEELRQFGEVKGEGSFFDVGELGIKLWQSALGNIARPFKEMVEDKLDLTFTSNPRVDLERAKAYSRTTWDKGIEVNPRVENRERVRGEIKEDLNDLPDIRAVGREEIYPEGEKLEQLPDIFVLSERWKVEKGFHGSPWNKTPIPDHHLDGIFVGYGADFEDKFIETSLLDLAPTFLELSGIQPPEGMEGSSLLEQGV